MNPKAVGELVEIKSISRLIELGYSVSLPFGNNQRYDAIIDNGLELKKIQIKSGRIRNGCLIFNTASVNGFTGKRKRYTDQIDLFIVYCIENDTMYMIPLEECGVSSTSLRLEGPKKDFERIRWAKDYVAGWSRGSSLGS